MNGRLLWDALVVTAGGEEQAETFRAELRKRLAEDGRWMVIPDPAGKKLGSGGATVHGLRTLISQAGTPVQQRVLMIHAGGEKMGGELFSVLPGETQTVFDELLALSTEWLERMPPGLVVSVGDVALSFKAGYVDWRRPGVTGVAIRQPASLAGWHGVYVTDEQERVYTYLEKPSVAEVKAAGGLLEGGRVALDTGLVRFDPDTMKLLAEWPEGRHPLELYGEMFRTLLDEGVPFHCAVVDGEFTHMAKTLAFRKEAVALSKSGTDLRPLLAQAPGLTTLAATAHALEQYARGLEATQLTEAASQYVQASRFLVKAGYEEEAERVEGEALRCVAQAVARGVAGDSRDWGEWQREQVEVSAPPRIDLGGGWSDTPPFCLDWGGTVLNVALALNGEYPIRTTVTRLKERVIRCVSEETEETTEWRTAAELMEAPRPGSSSAIPRAALQMAGIMPEAGGIEIRMAVRLPIGSGLGTSSILAATVVRALAEMRGVTLTDLDLSDEVMRLEQLMTTGGGWQDQAGGIFPGVKLLSTGPGLRQRIRVQPVQWSEERRAELAGRLVLYYTGIRRIAKNLLKQVVCSYLAREVATVQVLHSIKTLAMEMAYAMREGDWQYLGQLLDRHWELNKVLDPHTTNAPINALLETVRPYIDGVKLAGAGGGGFLILLASSPEKARDLKKKLGDGVYEWRLAEDGMRVSFR